MPFFDYSLDELKVYRPPLQKPSDFESFWQDSLAQARQHPLEASFEPIDYGLKNVETFDVTFNGYGGQPIKGWFLIPRQRPEKLPCLVEFIGYG